MAPTIQAACKAFIAPNSGARSLKERDTHVPRSPRRVRHARCILVECPKRGDGQDWDGSHLLELLPKCDILIAARDCQGSWPRLPAHDARTLRMKSSSNPRLRLWVMCVGSNVRDMSGVPPIASELAPCWIDVLGQEETSRSAAISGTRSPR